MSNLRAYLLRLYRGEEAAAFEYAGGYVHPQELVCVPAGWDSAAKVEMLRETVLSSMELEPGATDGSVDFSAVVKQPKGVRAEAAPEEFFAKSEHEFLAAMQEQVKSAPKASPSIRRSAGQSSAAAKLLASASSTPRQGLSSAQKKPAASAPLVTKPSAATPAKDAQSTPVKAGGKPAMDFAALMKQKKGAGGAAAAPSPRSAATAQKNKDTSDFFKNLMSGQKTDPDQKAKLEAMMSKAKKSGGTPKK